MCPRTCSRSTTSSKPRSRCESRATLKGTKRMQTADDVVQHDLDYICESLRDEFTQMAGSELLLVGGAGFLGYYLVQSVLPWNRGRVAIRSASRCSTTSFGAFPPGSRPWVPSRTSPPCATTSPTRCLPTSVHSSTSSTRRRSRRPTYYRQYPIETMDANVNGLRTLLDYATVAHGRTGSGARASSSIRAARSTAIPTMRTSRPPRPTAATCPARARAPATTNRSVTARRSA